MKMESWRKLAPLGGNKMATRLVCYKDVWKDEQGKDYPEPFSDDALSMIDEDLLKLDEDKQKATCVGAGSMALSFMLKLYADRDSYNRSVNVYQSISFKHKPSKELINELLISTGNKFAHLEYVVKNEATYEIKGELK